MTDSSQRSLQATPEQIVYANLLEKGMYLGLRHPARDILPLCLRDLEAVHSAQ